MRFTADIPDADLDARIRAIFAQEYAKLPPVVEPPTPPPPTPGIPEETEVRYASPTGTGLGLTIDTPSNLQAGCGWINNLAPKGGTLRCLGGVYRRTASLIFDNPRNLGRNNWRVIRSHDLANPAIIETPVPNLQAAIDLYGGVNRILFYGLIGDGMCNNKPAAPSPGDGTQYMFRISEGGSTPAGKTAHHIWVKSCIASRYYSGAVGTLGMNRGIWATASELFCFEDFVTYECAHGAPWGGSAMAINHPRQGVHDDDVDDMFKPYIEGKQTLCGLIVRRCIGYRNYQAREDTSTNPFTDGNWLTTDYWNHADWGGGPDSGDYNRAALIEGNLTWGNGRQYAGTLTHPSAGVYYRFNTSVWDGQTHRHAEHGISNEAAVIGGWGGHNDVFRYHGNVIVYDPAMQHPMGPAVMAFSKDTSSGGPTPRPLSADWNLLAGTVQLGPVFANATNTIRIDPGLGTPPDHLAHNGFIPVDRIRAWATPKPGSSIIQPNCPYTPTDKYDIFGTPRRRGTLGAVEPTP